jgi:hypothetical protein
MAQDTVPHGIDSAEFMLKEYERLYTLMLNEDSKLDQRIGFFLTISTATLGGLLLLTQIASISPQIITTVTIGVLVVLLSYGIVIQNRVNMSRVQHAAYKQLINEIQYYFGRRDPEIAEYIKIRGRFYQGPKHSRITTFFLDRMRGTYNDLMGLTNALLCGGIALTLAVSAGYSSSTIIVWTIGTVAASLALFYFVLRYIRRFFNPWDA